jgi:addiction module HigA family antidote
MHGNVPSESMAKSALSFVCQNCGAVYKPRSQGATLDQDQRPIPGVLCLDGGRPGGGRDRGLPLEEDATMAKKLKPMHPGEVLREEFLVLLKISAGALAKACGLPRTRIEQIGSERTGVTADTALRLAKALGTTAQLWFNLQNDHDVADREARSRQESRSHRDRQQAEGGLTGGA